MTTFTCRSPWRRLAPIAVALLSACNEKPGAPAQAPPEPRAVAAAPTPPVAAAAARREGPAFTLPPEVAEALRGIEWEPLDFLEYLPELAYRVTPGCNLEYVDSGTLSYSDDAFGTVKQSFYQLFTLAPSGGGGWVRRPEPRIDHVQFHGGRQRLDAFLDLRGERPAPLSLEVSRSAVGFPSSRSPIFQATQLAARAKVSPMNAWPELPSLGEPATWNYNLIFDTPSTLASRPPARVEFVGWLRMGFQRVAYLTATWDEAAERIDISTALAHLQVEGRGPLRSSLQQNREIKGHYLISEHGHLVLARVDGMARVRNLFKVQPRRLFGQKRGPPVEHEVIEDRVFTFTTKLLSDCNGSLFSKVESSELSQQEVVELAESFFGLMALERTAEAAALLSPAIRYAFPDGGAPWLLLREHAKAVGTAFLGKPTPSTSDGGGVDFAGVDRQTKRHIYTTVRGAKIGGQPFLTFVGTSSRPNRAQWDVLRVSPGSIYSGSTTLIRPGW